MSTTRRTFLQTVVATTAAAQSTSPNNRIRLGVIGCGARSHELMQALLQIPSAEIVGVVDAYKGRVERAIDRVGGKARGYRDYREIMADRSIDGVVVVTPDHWHRRMVLDAIAAGKDVYCEKPLTYRSAEGVEIIAAAKKAGRIVQVGSQPVSSAAQEKAREIIRSGQLGKVTLIRAAYNRNTASGAWVYPIPPDASPQTVDWEAFIGSAPKRPFSLERFFRWRCFEDYSGGIATDLFVHLVTTIHFLMGATMPARVVAMGELYRWKDGREVPDTLNAVVEYPEGFTVNLSSTFNNQSAGEGSFTFLGTEGSLAVGGGSLTLAPEAVIEDNRWITDSWPKSLAEAYYKDPKIRATEAPFATARRTPPETIRPQGMDSNQAHLSRFLESMRTRQPSWEDAVQGHHAAAVAHMVNRSAKQKRLIEWDFAKDDMRA
jgi:predicted dehydrogenase